MGTQILSEQARQGPIKTRGLLAQTESIEKKTPLEIRKLEVETSPEFLEAKMQRLLAMTNPAGAREFELLTAGMKPEDKELARRVHLGIQARPSSAAIKYDQIIGPDGRTYTAAFDPRAVGAHVIGTGQTYGSGVGSVPVQIQQPAMPSVPAVSPTVIQAPSAAAETSVNPLTPSAIQTPSPFVSPTAQDKKFQESMGTNTAAMKIDAKVKLPKAKSTIGALEAATNRVERDIDQAIALAGPSTTGWGSWAFGKIPTTDALTLNTILTSILSNVGFDALIEMRRNSPTGGALGNVSDVEVKFLQSTLANLNPLLRHDVLKAQLLKVKEARREALNRARNDFSHDVKFFGLTDDDFSQQKKEAAMPITGLPQPAELSLEERLKKYQ
jgi:hypothetical protein